MRPKSWLSLNISVHSASFSRTLDFTAAWVFCRFQHGPRMRMRGGGENWQTLSSTSRNSASIKAREASSRCIFGPQFWVKAFASCPRRRLARISPGRKGDVCAPRVCTTGRWRSDGRDALSARRQHLSVYNSSNSHSADANTPPAVAPGLTRSLRHCSPSPTHPSCTPSSRT